jgi:hypothetical protein
MKMLAELTVEHFTPLLGETFRIHTDAGPVHAQLIQAKQRGRPSPSAQRHPFSIQFRIAADVRLSQRMYNTDHDSFEIPNLFLVPIQPDAEGNRLEAIFN